MSAVTPVAPVPVAPTTALRARRGRRKTAGRIGVNAVALVVFGLMVFPVYWMVSTAFKPGRDILTYTPTWFPVHATLFI